MKVLIYGAGVIGSIFAAKLSLSGEDVTILARGKRLEEIRNLGVIICNPKTNKKEIASVKVIDNLSPGMKFDYIFVTMQRTQINSVLKTLALNCSKNIVMVVNTSAGYQEWASIISPERLMVGFPSAGGERANGIVNYFVGRGIMRVFQTTTFGEVQKTKKRRSADVIRMFNRAGIPSVFCSDMDAWQKTHVALVTGIANALYGHSSDNRLLASSWHDIKEMVLGIQEGFAVLRKLGIKHTPRKLIYLNLPASVLTVVFKILMGTKLAEVTMAKHTIEAKKEMLFLQNEFDQLIRTSGLKTPHIDSLKKNLFFSQ